MAKPHIARKFGGKIYWLAETTKTKALAKKGSNYLKKVLKIKSRVAKIPESGFGITRGHKFGIYAVKKIGISTDV
jgi:hypothetical protein